MKRQWPLAEALAIATKIKERLSPGCSRIEIAGSIRRKKPLVGDIEIVYVPRLEQKEDRDLLIPEMRTVNAADEILYAMIEYGEISPENRKGNRVWGEKIKLSMHIKTGIPIDFFSSTEEGWWSYLVCRTGSAESNMRLATAAKNTNGLLGWKPYEGFLGQQYNMIHPTSEEDVFIRAGLPYLEPELR